MKKKKQRVQRLVTNKNRYGYIFVAPFIVGFVFFVFLPIIKSLIFSMSSIELTMDSYVLKFTGLASYKRALLVDADIRRLLTNALAQTFTELPVILAFSFFAALLLKDHFKGRNLVRAIFFLPVIMASGVIATIDNSNATLAAMMNRNTADLVNGVTASLSANKLILSLFSSSIPPSVLQLLGSAIDRIYDIIMASGLQIIIFIGGLHTISPSVFEASNIEGATAWENFWKITFPMMGPYLLLNMVYTVIDSFMNIKNPLIMTIQNYLISFSEFSFASAVFWIYFVIILAIVGILLKIMSKKVFYYD